MMSFAGNFKNSSAKLGSSVFSNNNRPKQNVHPSSPAMRTNSPALYPSSPAMRTNSPALYSSSPAIHSSSPAMIYHQPVIIGMRNQLPESEPMSEYSELQMPPKRASQGSFQHQSEREGPMTPRAGSQRMIYQGVRASPYPGPGPSTLSLLAPPTPQCFVTQYSDQSFIMQPMPSTSVSSDISPTTSKKSVSFSSPAGKIKTSNNKNSKSVKVSSVSRTRYMIGSVDQVVRWHKIAKKSNLYVLYEVAAIVMKISKSPNAYNIILRSEQNDNALPLQAKFYPIDRDLPSIEIGQLITCVGRMVGANKLQVFNLWPTTSESLAGHKRISFLCQHSLQEVEP